MSPTTRAQAGILRFLEAIRQQVEAVFASFERFRLSGEGNMNPIQAAATLRGLVEQVNIFLSRYPERRVPDNIRQHVCRILLSVITRVLEYNIDVYATARWRAPNYVNRPEHNNLYLQLIGNPPANLDPLFAVGVLRIIINADDVRLFEDQIDGITDRLERLRAPAAYVQVFREIEHMADDEEEDEDEDEDEEDEEDQEDDDQEGIF